jgi:hypothetical protein
MNKIGLLHFVSIATTTGKDATNDFEDVGHSVDAHNLMKDSSKTTEQICLGCK